VQVSDRIDSHMINNQEIKFTKRKAQTSRKLKK
jgi:uncharacterized protein YeeX (DUF496 family)